MASYAGEGAAEGGSGSIGATAATTTAATSSGRVIALCVSSARTRAVSARASSCIRAVLTLLSKVEVLYHGKMQDITVRDPAPRVRAPPIGLRSPAGPYLGLLCMHGKKESMCDVLLMLRNA